MKSYIVTIYYSTPLRRKQRRFDGVQAETVIAAEDLGRQMFAREREKMSGSKNYVEATVTSVTAIEPSPSPWAKPEPAVALGQGASWPVQLAPRDHGFLIGDRVAKVSGYIFDGVVVSAFNTTANVRRYVVESIASPGLLHIFSGAQLRMA